MKRVYGLEGRTYGPADYLVGIRVCYERQVAHALVSLHIRYVGNLDLVGP